MSENNLDNNKHVTIDEEKSAEKTKLDHRDNVLREAVLIDQLVTQKLQEQRSLEILLRQQFSDHKNSFDTRVKIYSSIFSLLLAVLGFFGYSEVKKFVSSQVGTQLDAKLITPEVKKTVRDALETQTNDFVTGKIDPLNRSIDGMRKELANLQTTANLIDPLDKTVRDLSAETKSAKSDALKVSEETATLSLYYNVRRGDRASLNQLISLAKDDQSQKGKLAKSLVDDSNLYFQEHKYNLVQREIINPKTRQHMRPSAEEIYNGIYNHKDDGLREAYINEIGERNFQYFVQDLVKIIRDDPNLKVACRAEKIVEKLTGERFEDYPPYHEVQRWWDEKGNKDVKYSNSLHRLSERPAKLSGKEIDSFLGLLNEIVNSRQGMCRSQADIGQIYLAKNDKDKAKEHLKLAVEECDGDVESIMRYASLLYLEGNKDDVINMLKKAVPFVKDVVDFEKRCRSSFPNITNEDSFKKLFKDK